MNEKERTAFLHYYCDNEMQHLKTLVGKVLFKMGRSKQFDLDEFYSIANEQLWNALDSYDPNNEQGAKFETYLSVILQRKFNTEFSSRDRIKRGGGISIISLEGSINDSDDISIMDMIASNDNVEESVIENDTSRISDYLKSLSKKERQIADLIMEGYSISEITEKLGLSKKEMENILRSMRCYERKKLLEINNVYEKKENEKMDYQSMSTMEKSKSVVYSVECIIRKMTKREINFEHPLQRYAGQWSNKMKSDLVSDILQGNPIPALIFAEQVINGVAIIFDLDGKQRCTTVKEFKEDGFKISKNVARNIISYQHFVQTEDGKQMVDENGYPIVEWCDFDIANKKYSQLPAELQDLFNQYSFDVTLYLNCSDEDVAYHIQRYNQGKPMNGMQKGITKLGEDFARKVKEISALPFFRDTEFTFKQTINGTVERVVIEGVMAANFVDDWKKSPEDIAVYIDNNATFEMLEEVEDSITRIEEHLTEKSSELFNAKNTFLWLALFERFKKLNLTDDLFNDFLEEFIDEYQYREVNGVTFATIDKGKNTKDKQLIVDKLNHLEELMNLFLFESEE